jgi:hypothetical protein
MMQYFRKGGSSQKHEQNMLQPWRKEMETIVKNAASIIRPEIIGLAFLYSKFIFTRKKGDEKVAEIQQVSRLLLSLSLKSWSKSIRMLMQ